MHYRPCTDHRILKLGAVGGLMIVSSLTWGADFCADSPSSLQTALLQAAINGEDDRVRVVQGNYTGNFVYTSGEAQALEVLGGYTASCTGRVVDATNTELSGTGSGTVLALTSTANAAFTVDGLTITGGNRSSGGGGGLYAVTTGDVTLSRNAIHGNSAGYNGGGVYIDTDAGVVFTENTISNNMNDGAYIDSPSVTLTDNSFANNTLEGADVTAKNGVVTITGNDFTANTGDGIQVLTYLGSVDAADNLFVGNTNDGLYIASSAGGSSTGNQFSTNGRGLLFYASGGTVIITENVFSENSGRGGAEISAYSSAVTMADNSFSDNSTSYTGGGASVTAATLELSNNDFVGNHAASEGGGCFVSVNSSGDASATISNNRFFDNQSAREGAGINVQAYSTSSATLVNNTFANNTVTGTYTGGGAYIKAKFNGPITLTNNSFSGNSAASGGGLGVSLYDETDHAGLHNNLFWDNTSILDQAADLWIDNDGDNDFLPSSLSILHNDFDQSLITGYSTTIPVLIDPSNLNAVDPLFADQDLHLAANSPVINRGDNSAPALPATDMDGGARIAGGTVDIGADEFAGAQLDPLPDVQINGQDGVVSVANGELLELSFALNPGSHGGESADLMLGLYLVSSGRFIPVVNTTLSLRNIPRTNLPELTLRPGIYVWLMAVDLNPDGIPQFSYLDYATAVVGAPTMSTAGIVEQVRGWLSSQGAVQ